MATGRGGRNGRALARLVVASAALAALVTGSVGTAAAAASPSEAVHAATVTSAATDTGHAKLHLLHGHLPGRGVNPHSASVRNNYALSTNWSGQVATGGTYDSVGGSWTVPTVSGGSSVDESATWIGIDGTSSQTLIQTGTSQQAGSYQAWWEVLPNAETTISEYVAPGDAISATVAQVATNLWRITISDTTENWTFTHQLTYVTPRASAEWIEEAPTLDGLQTTINDYGSATFTGMTVTGPGTATSAYSPVYLASTDQSGDFTGISSWPDTYTGSGSFTVQYGSPTPVVTSVTPATGTSSGGSVVTVSGQYIFAAAKAYFGVNLADAFYLDANGSLTVSSPSGVGTVDILLTSDDTSSSAVPADHFTYSSSAPRPSHGYWLVGADGGIFSFGSAGFHGSTGNLVLQRPVVGITPTADRNGYWLVATDGGVFAFGDAGFYGSIPGLGIAPAGSGAAQELNAPIVGMVPSTDDRGYFMVAADGGVFAFGDAQFEGSCPGIGGCSGSAVSVMPDATGHGYWLVTDTGFVYTFGDAASDGQPVDYNNGQPLPSGAITSAVRTPDGLGYWVLIADGFVLPFGDANLYQPTHGDAYGAVTQTNPATAIFATGDKLGYWVASADGSVFDYGDAPADGSMAGKQLNAPIIAATGW
jgi:hypothetical protein